MSAWGRAWGSSFLDAWGAVEINAILNANATVSVPINYSICDRTGFRVSIHRPLIEDGYGHMVRLDSYDPVQPQDRIQSADNTQQRGPQSPENNDSFVDGDFDPDKDF